MEKFIDVDKFIEHCQHKDVSWSDDWWAFESEIVDFQKEDVVSWQWLKQYDDGKRVNFASGFVAEAERAYKEEQHETAD